MRRLGITMALVPVVMVGCASQREAAKLPTLAELHRVEPDVTEATVEQGLDHAMTSYRRFLDETPETAMTPEAMRRLADLQIENQFGIRTGDGTPRDMAAPEVAGDLRQVAGAALDADAPLPAASAESDQDFERRATAGHGALNGRATADPWSNELPGIGDPETPLEAIALYDRLLSEYPGYENSDQVLYQKARAYDELGRTDEAMATMDRLIRTNPHSLHYDEVQFRRGEYLFTRRKYRDAEDAYSAITSLGAGSSYYELALYKLGWALYKQELYEDALHRYIALLDYKVSIGYDFDQTQEEEDERRVSDTYRVISFSLSNLGGPEAVRDYFAEFGSRSYEDRVYANLGEHYLAKLRYDDAAKTYRTFEDLYPLHRAAPQFSMRVVETFTRGGFPKLVLEAKREFASRYGLQGPYWLHFTPEESPEVITYLKANLTDLANHYHAVYQGTEDAEEKLAGYREALRWYGDYLESFPADPEAPAVNYQLAELLLEHESFGEAARQYERTAYEYASHPRSAAAGYAAVYAYREHLKVAGEATRAAVKRDTVASSLRFADTFPAHEHAPAVLGAAADDLYEMRDYPGAVAAAERVLEAYPDASAEIRRSAWVVVAHGAFDLTEYAKAEHAYTEVLAVTPEEDEAHAGFVDNLAATIYKQGELAGEAQDHRAAADHFLRIRYAAPTSGIRPTAEYDAGAALLRLEDWVAAAEVLEDFRSAYPEHELRLEATRQIASAYREDGQLSRAAAEYDRFGSESGDPALRSEALQVAGDLYAESGESSLALDVYQRYVDEFPHPVESALEIRFKIAEIHRVADDEELYHGELSEIVRLDAEAGAERTSRTQTLAARSALVLAEGLYGAFVEIELLQPFEVSLQQKRQQMDRVIDAMGRLVDYEIAEVTAAATFYMAETYFDFSRSLAESERPADLGPAEMQEYELVLDEEAFPFEERAIDVHEKNVELLQAGAFNAWTEKSLGRLADLVPGRYAKAELSTGFQPAIDQYVYRSPAPPVPAIESVSSDTRHPGELAETTYLGPTAMDD